MQILDPNLIKQEKKETEAESRQRIITLSAEETKITNSLNAVKQDDKIERKKIVDEFDEFKSKTELERLRLLQEVETLESRRKDTLRPISELTEQAERLFQTNTAQLVETEKKLLEIADLKADLVEIKADLKDHEQEVTDREEDVTAREQNVKKVENSLKTSSENLQFKWTEYHKDVAVVNKTLAEREQKVSAREIAVEEHAKALKIESDRQHKERKSLKDGYQSLERAREEILGRKQ